MTRTITAKRWVGVLAVVLLVAVPAPTIAQVPALSPATVDAVDRAIVLVTTFRDMPGGRVARGSGSGIVIDSNGLVLTANHVAENATRLEVAFRTGETYAAQVVGLDPIFDVALLRIQPSRPLPIAVLGTSSLLFPGEMVTAFGRAPRRQSGPTAGAFIEQDIEVRAGVPNLRSTASAWPGDSGGALVNGRGEAVGLIVAITRDGSISLAVASDAIKNILPDLRAGMVRHPWLGITGTTITDELVGELGLSVRRGVIIFEVVPGGPAAQAGLRGGRANGPRDVPRGGDVILAIDGRPISTFGQVASYVLSKRIGDTIVLDLLRDGQPVSASVVLGERPTL